MLKRFLAVLIIFSVLLLVFSCAKSEEAKQNEGTPDNTPAEDDFDGIVNRALYTEPEIKDFEEYNFRIIENPLVYVMSYHKQVPEEMTGEVVNDAFINRNRIIEDRYNITLSSVWNDDPTTALQRSISSGDNICDIGLVVQSGIFGLAQYGYLIDFNTVKPLRLNMPWWDQRIISGLSVYDKTYTLAGDITTNDDVSTLTILYNKNLYTELGYENPYEMVAKGEWTMDKLYEMTKGVNLDLNGDGIIDENDRWGMASESAALYYFFFGSGMHYIEKTPAGGYHYTLDSQKAQNVFEKTYQTLAAEDSIFDLFGTIKDHSINVYETIEKMFMEDRLLFNVRLVGDAIRLRNMEGSFGFLPFPKYDAAQAEYYSWVTWNAPTVVMPSTVPDAEKSGLIMEALAFESMFTIREPFYGNLLDVKVARDNEDTQMLDLILNSKMYDLDGVNALSGIQSGIFDMVHNMLLNRNPTFASSWERIQGRAEANLERFLSAFE